MSVMNKLWNPYLDEVKDIYRKMSTPITTRFSYTSKYAWAIPNQEAIETIIKYGPITEIGAGTGYWASLVQQMGGQIQAWDIKPYKNHWCDGLWFDVEQIKDIDDLSWNRHDTLFLCWPPYDTTMAYDALIGTSADHVIYVGEGKFGCTGDDNFHYLLDSDFEKIEEIIIPTWFCVGDSLKVYRRR